MLDRVRQHQSRDTCETDTTGRPMIKAYGWFKGLLCGTIPLGVPRYRMRGNLLHTRFCVGGGNVYIIQPTDGFGSTKAVYRAELLDSKELVPTTENPAMTSDDNQDSEPRAPVSSHIPMLHRHLRMSWNE